MSVVIIGGNERMVTQYENICKEHGCKAKVFAKENGSLKTKKNQIPVARVHTSSATALHAVLEEHCAAFT